MDKLFKADDVTEWIQTWMDEHSDEDNPDDVLSKKDLRIGAASILQFACDAGIISLEEYQQGLNPIVQRTHPELKEEFYGAYGKRILL